MSKSCQKVVKMSKISESKLQAECYQWFHNNYPNLRGLLCYNLNNSKNRIDGNRNKALGLQKGRSDMVIYLKGGKAVMIEMKSDTGEQSPAQIEWEKTITNAGYEYIVIRSFEQFKQTIIELIQKQP